MGLPPPPPPPKQKNIQSIQCNPYNDTMQPCNAAPSSAPQSHAEQPVQCNPCICGVVSFEQQCPAYLFHVISISHDILASQ